MVDLYFGGSVWTNIDIALRNIDTLYKLETKDLGVSVIELHILQALYKKDEQMPSRLAEAVGRPATSFTPILDKLENKGFIERRAHPADRRAVRIYLTAKGRALEQRIISSAECVEDKLREQFSDKDRQGFESVVAYLQTMKKTT